MDIWSAYMSRATEGDPPLGFPEADLSGFRTVYRSYYVDF
jgi:hypothetical protein